MIKEFIIKVDDSKEADAVGGLPLVEPPQELVRCKDCRHGEKICYGAYVICDKGYGIQERDWFCRDGV